MRKSPLSQDRSRATPTVQWHCSRCEQTFGRYVRAFGAGDKLTIPEQNFIGRVLRGTRQADFLTLSDNPQRRVVFMLDAPALYDLLGLSGRDILRRIGYQEDFIARLLEQGTQFKLVLLPAMDVQPATWDNLLDCVAQAYPTWQERIEQARDTLKNCTFEQVMLQSSVAAQVRAFLKDTLNVNRFFAGDGYTRHAKDPSMPAYAEYVTLNRRLSEFGAFALLSFSV